MENKTYLIHHGIKGQKWGVRQAAWYPIAEYKAAKKYKKNTIDRLKWDNEYVKDKTEVNKEIKAIKKYSTKEALIDQYVKEKLQDDAYTDISVRNDAADWMFYLADWKVSNIMKSYRLTGDIKDIAKKVKRATPEEIERYNPEDPIDVNDLLWEYLK